MIALPHFEHTEDAVRFGVTMTRDQYLTIDGGRQALQREFDRIYSIYRAQNPRDPVLLQILSDLACTIQKLRESLECAPNLVLASLITSTSQLAAEQPMVGHL